MKDGRLVEQGTHAELVARKGEYFKLYQVQAQAFTAEAEAGP
jgi:ABC-type multidrug transport system fused ATPase/permease subunit